MKFLVEVSDEEVSSPEEAREEIAEALDMETGFVEIKVTIFQDGVETERAA